MHHQNLESYQSCDCLVIGVDSQGHSPLWEAWKLEKIAHSFQGDRIPKRAQTRIYYPESASAPVVLLVGIGDKPLSAQEFREVLAAAVRALKTLPVRQVAWGLCLLEVLSVNAYSALEQTVLALASAYYRFDRFKTSNLQAKSTPPQAIQYLCPEGLPQAKWSEHLHSAQATALGMHWTQDLGNTPPNECTPSFLLESAQELARLSDAVQVSFLDEAQMQDLGMNAFLAVSKGSEEPAYLIQVSYQGKNSREKSPIVLVGKGITFDTGGLSLKPSSAMTGMKYDMSGAGTVLGVIRALIALNADVHVIGLLAAAENMPDGIATRPDDVVTSMSGQSIEINNIDAEGRLVLCDALTYAQRFNPDIVIDIATLTGACVVALGSVASGLFSNDEELSHELVAAAEWTNDRVWPLPIWPEYHDMLDSAVADFANTSPGRGAGSITAACFLSKFTKQYRWAHLDIAGTAYQGENPKTLATGRPVPLLMQFLKSYWAE